MKTSFWAHMADRSRERDLWVPYLHAAWPAGINRACLNLKLEAINKLRNRMAHNERLFNPGRSELSPVLVDGHMINLLRDLCPDAYEALHGDEKTAVERFLESHPAPVGARL